MAAASQGRIGGVLGIARVGQWWSAKLAPALAFFYAAAFLYRLAPDLWLLGAGQLIGALIPAACFASFTNDIADRREDRMAGKPNRLRHAAKWVKTLAIVVPLLAGLAWCWVWRDNPRLVGTYAAIWAAFALYSIKPFRLKRRGWLGPIVAAAGGHVLPALVGGLIAERLAGVPLPNEYLIMFVMVSGAFGLRSLLWHQLAQRDSDRAVGLRTVAVISAPTSLIALARWLVFPAELLGLAGFIYLTQINSAWVALALHVMVALQRDAVWGRKTTLIKPEPRGAIALADYYAILLPISILARYTVLHPVEGAIGIALHCVAFAAIVWPWLRDFFRLQAAQIGRLLAWRPGPAAPKSPRRSRPLPNRRSGSAKAVRPRRR